MIPKKQLAKNKRSVTPQTKVRGRGLPRRNPGSPHGENSLSMVLFTARKRSLGQGNIFRSVCQEFCPQGGWYPSMPCRYPGGVVSQHALQVPRPTPKGEVKGSGLGGYPGPHPGEKLRSLAWGGLQAHTQGGLRLTSGGGLQAHTQGGPQAHTQGVSRPHPGEGIKACTEADPPTDGYCCGRYASYWNAFLLNYANKNRRKQNKT